MVLRFRARARGDDLARLSAGRDPDDLRARDRRLRADLPGDDLEAVHGARVVLRAVPEGVSDAEGFAGLGHAPAAVRACRQVPTRRAHRPPQRRRRRARAATPTGSPRFRTTALSRRTWLRPAAVAIPIYLAACAVPDGGLFRAARYPRRASLRGFAHSVFAGRVPYRDFFMEYPPGALAVFLPPEVFGSAHYNAAFKCLMALCGVATIVLLASAARAAGRFDDSTLGRSPALRAVAARARADLAQHVRRVAGAAHARGARPAARRAGRGRVRTARRGVRGEGLSGRARSAGADLRLAHAWTRARDARVGSLRCGRRALHRAVPRRSRRTVWSRAFARRRRAPSRSRASAARCSPWPTGSACTTRRSCIAQVTRSPTTSSARCRSARRAELRRAGAGGCGRGVDLPARSLTTPTGLAVAFAAAIAGFLAFTRFFSPQYLVWLIPFVFILEPAAWVLAARLRSCSRRSGSSITRRLRARRLRLARADPRPARARAVRLRAARAIPSSGGRRECRPARTRDATRGFAVAH